MNRFQDMSTPPAAINTKTSHSRANSKSAVQSPRSPASPFDPLSSALSTAQARYTISNSQSLKAHNEACHDFPGGNTRTVLHSSPFPITFAKGNGCELTSLDGDTYIDFLGEFTAGIYGHSNKDIASAVTDVMKEGWNFGGPNKHERQLAKKVTKRFGPSGVELVRFTNSGTEANTMALAASVAYTGRKKVLAFKNAYHGGTLSFPPSLLETNTNLPHDFILAPYNDIEGTRSVISSIPADSLAAIIVECIQGSGGCIVGSAEFLQFLNSTANKLGAIFIVDEVMTSRLSYHGFSSFLGLTPDLVTLGKWVGGGMTFGAFGGRKDGGIMSMFDPREGILSHSGTFNNNVITMAAGCVGLDIYGENEVELLGALGESLKFGIERTLAAHGITGAAKPADSGSPAKTHESGAGQTSSEIHSSSAPIAEALPVQLLSLQESTRASQDLMWVSGKGSMLCIHFAGDSEKTLLALFWHHMLDHGIYLAQRGFMALNMRLKDEHVAKFLNALESFVNRYEQALR